ncbi:tumor necrosis factor alpha-induced protein 2 isoform X1 [Sebastes umbrosus]|uniref:tumor necrosis factor alpha-induced protein 2 isoform X1 n=2 Tax=Sebastes umbrosus TaxID=72105 RepID=UPI00189DB021|nr:tumor necrosis factor alpha-induced protein 2 isoform X1 [Sebastes umbrosus]
MHVTTNILTSNVTCSFFSAQSCTKLQTQRKSKHLPGGMCSTLRCCLPCRSCRAEDSLESFSDCWSSLLSQIRMRTETNGWFNFRRGPRVQPVVNNTNNTNNTTNTDGRRSPGRERAPSVVLTYEQILEAKRLCEASRLLIEREERLFEEIKESDELTHHEEEVWKLAADRNALEALVKQTLSLSLDMEEDSSEALASAVKAMTQEEDQDRKWTQRGQTPPPWRPSGWKKVHDSTLGSLVVDRLDSPSTPPADKADQSSINVDVNSMGRQLKDDLLAVVRVVKSCYPPQLDICNFYARLYHQAFSTRLRKVADFVLDDKDCKFLLRWVNEYYPLILSKPELVNEIDNKALGKLLPKELLEPLEDQYLSKQQEELTTYIGRVLEEAKQKWNKGEEPTTEDGCFVSPVAYDIIQFINGGVTSAEKVVGDLHKAQNITCQLKDLMQRFRIFQNEVMKQNKANSRPVIKANLGCIEQFRDVLDKKRHLFTEDVQRNCVHVLTDMKQSAHVYLLKPVHEVLKPQYRKLGTNDWLSKPNLFEKLLVSVEDELQDLQGVIESCHQRLMGQLHQEVTVEYVRRLLKGQVKLKDKERQLKAYETVKDNAERVHVLFVKMGSEEDWLKEILTKIAEVLKLQDLPAIQMQVASLGTEYPDLSEKHVSALLKLKTNLSKADRKTVKDILSDTRDEQSKDRAELRPFFSGVPVK